MYRLILVKRSFIIPTEVLVLSRHIEITPKARNRENGKEFSVSQSSKESIWILKWINKRFFFF